jgi:hypothetical protein
MSQPSRLCHRELHIDALCDRETARATCTSAADYRACCFTFTNHKMHLSLCANRTGLREQHCSASIHAACWSSDNRNHPRDSGPQVKPIPIVVHFSGIVGHILLSTHFFHGECSVAFDSLSSSSSSPSLFFNSSSTHLHSSSHIFAGRPDSLTTSR